MTLHSLIFRVLLTHQGQLTVTEVRLNFKNVLVLWDIRNLTRNKIYTVFFLQAKN